MKSIVRLFAALIVSIPMASMATAAVVSYSEASSGDLQTSPPANLGALDAGSNIISGSSSANCQTMPTLSNDICGSFTGDTRDSFLVTYDSTALEIVSVTATVSNFSYTGDATQGGATGSLNVNTLGTPGLTGPLFTTNGVSTLLGTNPISETIQITMEASVKGIGDLAVDWQIEFVTRSLVVEPPVDPETPAVPVPAGLPLLLSGFGALALARRARKKSS